LLSGEERLYRKARCEAAGMGVTDFDTKAAIVVRDDLAAGQRLNVTAFLTSGITAAAGEGVVGEHYVDADGVHYLPLLVQPVLVFEASAAKLTTVRRRASESACARPTATPTRSFAASSATPETIEVPR
jgi:hypothetical protein